MKTLLLAPELFGSDGGISRILRLYLKALCELAGPDDRVAFVALNDGPAGPGDLQAYSNDRLGAREACGRSKLRFIRRGLREARGCGRIVCGHVAQLPVAWLARAMNPALRYYLVAHGIEVWRPFGLAERVALRGAHRILCVSEFTRRQVLGRLALDPARLVVLPNALDPGFEVRGGRPLSECPPVILTVTRLAYADRYKGVDSLIESMASVRAAVPGARLRIVGGGDDLGRLRDRARACGVLDSSVEFLGRVDDRRLAQELGECRLFALPSGREGFGLAFLEAMAHGRPSLGARAGGVPEVLNADTGILVAEGDVPAIAAGCIAALRRNWREEPILERARSFSYSPFKARLASLLDA
jgi:glycosyltransferase involved in cell wall biosynthesis